MRHICFLIVSLLVTIPGCGGGGIKPVPVDKAVPVTGKITLDGKPLGNALVTFSPTLSNQGFGASGTTDSTGKYELNSLVDNQPVVGAPKGKYKVTISHMLLPDGTPQSPDSKEPPIMSGARESLPMRYSDFTTTTLSASVSSSGGTYDFDIKSK